MSEPVITRLGAAPPGDKAVRVPPPVPGRPVADKGQQTSTGIQTGHPTRTSSGVFKLNRRVASQSVSTRAQHTVYDCKAGRLPHTAGVLASLISPESAAALNDRPRKTLGCMKLSERLAELLALTA